MSSRVSLSRRDAEALLTADGGKWVGEVGHAFARLRSALAPKPKRVAATKAREAAKATKRATKREQTAEVRAAVMARADGVCECGCGRRMHGSFVLTPTMDHFWGRARAESVETCWALADGCHYAKTNNSPDRAAWLRKFYSHCVRYGYQQEARKAERELDAEALIQAAAAVTGGAR